MPTRDYHCCRLLGSRPVSSRSTPSSYSGDLITPVSDEKIQATQNTGGSLSGTSQVPKGVAHTFGATLSGKTLTVTFDSSTIPFTKVSSTPAAAPHTLASYAGSVFSYESPPSWSARQGPLGIVLQSGDKSEQVSVLGGLGSGIYGVNTIAVPQQKAGATLAVSTGHQNGWIASALYAQQADCLFLYSRNGARYATMETITTITNYNAGTYNASTHTYSGETLTLVSQITAPEAQFVSQSARLLTMLGDIEPESSFRRPTCPVCKGHGSTPPHSTVLKPHGSRSRRRSSRVLARR